MVRLGLNGCCYQFAAKKRKRRKNPKRYVSHLFLRFFAPFCGNRKSLSEKWGKEKRALAGQVVKSPKTIRNKKGD